MHKLETSHKKYLLKLECNYCTIIGGKRDGFHFSFSQRCHIQDRLPGASFMVISSIFSLITKTHPLAFRCLKIVCSNSAPKMSRIGASTVLTNNPSQSYYRVNRYS